uniref:Uncharacterized protein n=1 Tax=Lotus japonicus TaxID=34305 RepID=I3S5F0_LOTJA|nr:unknown [Lotus japonicus]
MTPSNWCLTKPHHQFLSNLLLRSVKPRTTMFPHMDFSVPQLQNPNNLAFQMQRFGVPLRHHLRLQPINLPNNMFVTKIQNFVLVPETGGRDERRGGLVR